MEYKYLKIFKVSMFGIGIGVLIFISSFFVSAANGGYFYTATGVGVVIASIITLLFGMCLSLMDEVTEAEIRNKETKLYFVPKRTFH
ncbi:hypothetical protein IEC97_24950 [Neobacillus cucumis]|uniref:hypothetical protein n=1 Tax=Neobacillus cucumis TaxID=1740721 RepID=UPI0018DF0B8D|nr:hypothetical protein [Neobacillus cucumis]MBI0580599.1 hypothetical protein [Neobacillus cucumis]WHY89361.1 hypothetical protein QNK12_16790 [Neobacillus cucumis]